jgi:hypothetical protein
MPGELQFAKLTHSAKSSRIVEMEAILNEAAQIQV